MRAYIYANYGSQGAYEHHTFEGGGVRNDFLTELGIASLALWPAHLLKAAGVGAFLGGGANALYQADRIRLRKQDSFSSQQLAQSMLAGGAAGLALANLPRGAILALLPLGIGMEAGNAVQAVRREEWLSATFHASMAVLGAAVVWRLLAFAPANLTVWTRIRGTQPVYEGTPIPRSFEMRTAHGRVWVHGNATEHIAQDVAAIAQRGASPEIVNLASQARLTSLYSAVEQAMQGGIRYNTRMTVNGWQLEFRPPRNPGELPTIIHARYSGG